MNNRVYAEVPVGTTTILSLKDGNTVYVPLRNLCENLAVDWSNERRRILKDPILSKAVVKFTTALSNGQEQLLLPLPYLAGWLFKINLNTVNEDARPVLEMIQRESYEALYTYWFRAAAINPRLGQPPALSAGELLRLVDRLKREWQPEIRAMLHALLGQMCDRLSLPLPRIEAFGQPEANDLEIAERFFAGLADLREAGLVFDYHRRPDLLALSLPEIEKLFADRNIESARGPALWQALRQHPAFIGRAPVNGRDERTRQCWVFTRAKVTGFALA